MTEVSKNPAIRNLPDVGYYISKEGKKQEINESESHIHRQNALTGMNVEAHKLTNDILTYFPKGFAGSKNSNFYEFLSLGKIPYLIGSVLLIALYTAAIGKNNHKLSEKTGGIIDALKHRGEYSKQSASAAMNVAKKMGAGVVLYGIGKWLSKKVSHKLIHASTGVNLDMKYTNIVTELPEPGKKIGMKRIEYPGVFDSADFPRKDLIAMDSQLNHDNIYYYEDKLAKKAGFKDNLNAPNQTMWPKIRELKVRTTALENINQYIAAATGVAIGAQESFEKLDGSKLKFNKKFISKFFENISEIKEEAITKKLGFQKIQAIKPQFGKIKNITGFKEKLKFAGKELKTLKNYVKTAIDKTSAGAFINVLRNNINQGKYGIINNAYLSLKGAVKELWRGTPRNKITKNYGKVLIIGTVASTLLTWLIPTINFKKNPNTMKSKIDTKKGYEVC